MEVSGAAAIGENKVAEESNEPEQAKIGSASHIVKKLKDDRVENGTAEDKNGAPEVKDAQENNSSEMKLEILKDEMEDTKEEVKIDEVKNNMDVMKHDEDSTTNDVEAMEVEKDNVVIEEMSNDEVKGNMEVMKDGEDGTANGAEEIKVDKDKVVVEETMHDEVKLNLEVMKDEKETENGAKDDEEKKDENTNGAEEIIVDELKLGDEEMKSDGEKDNVELLKKENNDMGKTKSEEEITKKTKADEQEKEEQNADEEKVLEEEELLVGETTNNEEKDNVEGMGNEKDRAEEKRSEEEIMKKRKVDEEAKEEEKTKVDEEQNVAEEVKKDEEKTKLEVMKIENEDNVKEIKGEDIVEKSNGVENMDNKDVSAHMVKDKEEGKVEKDVDAEMTEAISVKNEEQVKLSTSGIELDGVVEEQNSNADMEEDGRNQEVGEKVTNGAKRRRGKQGKSGARSAPKEKKENGDSKERKVNDEETEKNVKRSLHTSTPPTIERPVRVRKTVQRFVEIMENEPNKRVVIEKGRGTPLKDIPKVANKLGRRKPEDLKLLHQMLFGRIGKAPDYKHRILQFSGFVWHESDEKQRSKLNEKLDKCVKDDLLDLCDLLDLPISKSNSKKEELISLLLDFLAIPHARTEDQETPKSGKRKRVTGGSSSKKQSRSKRMKSEGTVRSKGKDAEDSEEDDYEEENSNVSSNEDEEHGASESEKENNSVDVAAEKDNSDESGKGRQSSKGPKKQTDSSGKKTGSKSKKENTFSVSSAKSPKKTPSTVKSPASTGSKSVESNDAGEKVFSRKKKMVDSPMGSSTPKEDAKSKSGGNRQGKDKPKFEEPKSQEADKYGPSADELRKTICEYLSQVDLNTATFTDILKRLATHYKVDLTPIESSIKEIMTEELTKLAEAADGNEDEEAAEDEDKPKTKA